MKNILSIVKFDLTAMRAKKFSLGKVFIIAFIASAVTGLILPPMLLVFSLIVGCITIPAFLDLENRNGGEAALAVLPVTRKETVIARFGLITLVLTANCIVTLIVSQLSRILDVSHFFESTAGLNESLSELFDLGINDFGLFSLLLCGILTVSLIFSAMQLGDFFKTGKNENGKSLARLALVGLIIWMVIGTVMIIEISLLEVKVLSTALGVLASLFTALTAPYNGLLLDAVLLMAAYGFVFYKAACAVLDYEAREL